MQAWQDYDLWIRLIHAYGNALKLANNSIIIDLAHSNPRITTSDREGIGYTQFTKKHNSLLSDYDKKQLKIVDLYNRKIRIEIKDVVTLSSGKESLLQLLKLYLITNIPLLEVLIYKAINLTRLIRP